MAILFSGDFHSNASHELSSITKSALLKKYKPQLYESIKYHIILGDGGFLWPGEIKADLYNFRALGVRHFPILCVIGNHEPMLGMKNLLEVDLGFGETVLKIWNQPFIAYLKRGKVYTIEGIKFLVLGGALSIDKEYREPDISWWYKEYWSEKEEQDLYSLLRIDNFFDFVISHTGPDHINSKLFGNNKDYLPKFVDKVALLNDNVHASINFREWWCGHWHKNLYYYDKNTYRGYQYLYKSTKILDKVGNNFHVYNEYNMLKR